MLSYRPRLHVGLPRRDLKPNMLPTWALNSATDTAIWDYAQQIGAVLITKDEDFAVKSTLQPAVVWIRLGNTTKAELLRWFEPTFSQIINALERGETLIEIT